MEKWKEVKGLNGLYLVSDEGRVKSAKSGKLLSQSVVGKKYYKVAMADKDRNKMVQVLVHRLVAQHFVPNPDNYKIVTHIDNDYSNNVSSNLKWISGEEAKDKRAEGIRRGHIKREEAITALRFFARENCPPDKEEELEEILRQLG